MRETILEVQNVSKRYGDVVAVDNLTLKIFRGEIYGFLGPNGAGKTTTIKLMTGLLRPDAGTIRIAGFDITKEPVLAKKHIGYIPDNPYIYERLTGREFLELVGSLYNMPKKIIDERIEWLFELLGVGKWGDDFAAQYSHGMRQKIIMASAIIHDPDIVIIDEPMVGLDPQSQRLAKNIFLKLSERGSSVFLSTHTLSIAEELCHRIGIIHLGRLLREGTIDELRGGAEVEGYSLEELFVALTGSEKEVRLWQK